MLIIANNLHINGGTTFILRLSKELKKQNNIIGVLVLQNKVDKHLESEIKKHTDIYYLRDFIHAPVSALRNSQLGCFSPLKYKKLYELIDIHEGKLHIMGMFGLFLSLRVAIRKKIKITLGVYHQNEYMFTSKSFFSKYLQKIISKIDYRSLIFYNEANIASYSDFFKSDFSKSTLLPIGIEIPSKNSIIKGGFGSARIVSIGNLFKFKTYNLHIINILEELLAYNDKITYEIYGEGPLKKEIEQLIVEKKYQDKVFLKGNVPYENFQSTLNESFLFVGSGTALIEAAAIGIPSLIGIESTDEPITFGFINEVDGFSYNELNDFQETSLMENKIKKILTDKTEWQQTALDCKSKAKDFSITKTAVGLLSTYDKLPSLSLANIPFIRLFLSFLLLGILDKLNIDKAFSGRRN